MSNTKRIPRPKPARPPSRELVSKQWKHIGRDALAGVVLTILLLILKLSFEKTTPGKLLEDAVYCWLQTRLTAGSTPLPVVVVDISQLDAEPVRGRLTPREQLTRLLDVITEQGAAAIGIDVDFSPGGQGWTSRGGPQLFDHLHNLRIPVFLGVSRSRFASPQDWLGAEDYQKLAATIAVPKDDRRRMPLWIGRGDSEACLKMAADLMGIKPKLDEKRVNTGNAETATCLPAMSAVLARKYPNLEPYRALGPSWLLDPLEEVTLDKGQQLHTAYFFVDYSAVDELRAQTLTAVVSDHDVRLSPTPGSLIGKIMMLGNTQWENTLDKYPVPPWQIETPGVYLHASAIYTLIKGPLLEITTAGRVGLDVFFAMGVLGVVSGLRIYYSRQAEVAAHRVNVLFTCLAILVVVAFGYGFVQYTRILWTDFVLVSAALAIHSMIEGHLETFGEKMSVIWHRVVFVDSSKGESS